MPGSRGAIVGARKSRSRTRPGGLPPGRQRRCAGLPPEVALRSWLGRPGAACGAPRGTVGDFGAALPRKGLSLAIDPGRTTATSVPVGRPWGAGTSPHRRGGGPDRADRAARPREYLDGLSPQEPVRRRHEGPGRRRGTARAVAADAGRTRTPRGPDPRLARGGRPARTARRADRPGGERRHRGERAHARPGTQPRGGRADLGPGPGAGRALRRAWRGTSSRPSPVSPPCSRTRSVSARCSRN